MRTARLLRVLTGALLAAAVIVGVVAYARQLAAGLQVTGLSREAPWGLYVAQLTFTVGIAASSVMVVLPYYLHDDSDFARLIMLGEVVSICAVLSAMLFVFVDMGQPARVFNVLLHPAPGSLMFWDLLALSGYLVQNLILWRGALACAAGGTTRPAWHRALAVSSIPWAIAIHTVTALLYAGLSARPAWLTAIVAPRFLASAFASGPALLVLVAVLLRRATGFDVGRPALGKLMTIVAYALSIHLLLSLLELFTSAYGGDPGHAAHLAAVLWGGLAPFTWAGWILGGGALVVLLVPRARRHDGLVAIACVATVAAVWFEKGFSFIVGGFVPSPFGTVPRYWPTWPEISITAGVYGVGLLLALGMGQVTVAAVNKGAHAPCTR
jgi:molybdopterin-containing oxidoreductase family membrane subunit